MKKNVIKILKILILMIFIINKLNTTIYASALGDVIKDADSFIDSSSKSDSVVELDTDKLQVTSSDIYNILLMISFVVVAVVGIVLGIKFMMSTPEEKANLKKSLIIFLIGCVVIYGSFGIWKAIVNVLNKL